MRQAWREKLKPVLVINKIDRLFMELRMEPDEAANHLSKLLAVVNVSVATLILEHQFEKENQKIASRSQDFPSISSNDLPQSINKRGGRNTPSSSSSSSSSSSFEGSSTFTVSLEGDSSWKVGEINDEDAYFSPELGNVLFCSAVDGWGFRSALSPFSFLLVSQDQKRLTKDGMNE